MLVGIVSYLLASWYMYHDFLFVVSLLKHKVLKTDN